jgi:predicted phosphoadenosine phosphosulfate sulfurtransferase
MPRRRLTENVFDAALERLTALYRDGHRIVVSFSAGKDSGVCLELAIMAARSTGRLPVEVVMRDEEVMYPGTFEYAERVACRPEVAFHWLVAHQPIVNVFDRVSPYFWTFDPMLPPEEWVRQPPSCAETIPDLCIERMTIPERFPPPDGKNLYAVIGLRTQESRNRLMGLFSSGSHITKPNAYGVRNVRPIYDWTDGDVWRAYHVNGWDYNDAYNVLHRMGVDRNRLRIAPPTLNAAGLDTLGLAAKAWPQWFEKVAKRLPGVRTAAMFGKRAVQPARRLGETWEQCFRRECLEETPAEWIKERSRLTMERKLSAHAHHSTMPFPEAAACPNCQGSLRSWKDLAIHLYNGDPFSLKADHLPYVEPEFFREGAGTWGGKPTF